jgi:hypothetical protein
MGDSHTFALDVFRTVCAGLEVRADDLHRLVEAGSSFEEWLVWEAFLACKLREASYPFCEVAAKPLYASEGVPSSGARDGDAGDLRVGGPNDGANHCWVFAEFVLLHDGNRLGREWRQKIESGASNLKRLGWKKSAALLIVVVASRGAVLTDWADNLAGCAVWNSPPLTDQFHLALPGGGSVVVKALDIKLNPSDTLTAPDR